MSSGAIVFAPLTAQDIEIGVGTVDVPAPGGGTMRASRVNLATFAAWKIEVTWDFGTVPANGASVITLTVPGVTLGNNMVLVSFDGPVYLFTSSCILRGVVSAIGNVFVSMRNVDPAVPVNPGSGTLKVLVFQLPAL